MKGNITRFHRLEPDMNPSIAKVVNSVRLILDSMESSNSRIVSLERMIVYHRIGRELRLQSNDCLWGDKMMDEVSRQIRLIYPEYHYINRGNLYLFRTFYDCFPDESFVSNYVVSIPWTTVKEILFARKEYDPQAMVMGTIKSGWSTSEFKKALSIGSFPRVQLNEGCFTNQELGYVLRTAKVHIRPTHSQKNLFERYIGASMKLYNEMMDWALRYYLEHGLVLFREELVPIMRVKKRDNTDYQDVPEVLLQNVCSRVYSAIKNFDNDIENGGAHYPKLRNRQNYRSVTYDQYGTVRLQGEKLWLGSVPRLVKMSKHQIIGDIRNCTITCESSGKWYAYIVYRRNKDLAGLTCKPSEVGIDLGLNNRAILSDGTVYEMPQFNELEGKCDKIRSKRDRSDDPKYRAKCNKILSKMQARLNNKRSYILHSQTRDIVDSHTLIAVEKLDVPDIISVQEYSSKRRKIQAASWARFITTLKYKSEETNYCRVVEVDSRYSSQ